MVGDGTRADFEGGSGLRGALHGFGPIVVALQNVDRGAVDHDGDPRSQSEIREIAEIAEHGGPAVSRGDMKEVARILRVFFVHLFALRFICRLSAFPPFSHNRVA